MRIAIDAMGGDDAPASVVGGALVAARHLQIPLLLVGDRAAIERELGRHPGSTSLDIDILNAAQRIEMAESAGAALRRKPDSSIRVAADAVRDGKAAALFSAGHTGASLMAAHAAFGRLPGVDRPALATIIPTRQRPAVLLDSGANVEYGGAPLVGLNGLCIVGHGRSSPKAVRNAVAMAARFVNERLLEKLAREIHAVVH
jgi:glycerol-3-phosphate acyltransferase PlsX